MLSSVSRYGPADTTSAITGDEDLKRFEEMLAIFRVYGARYNFDPLMLAAQGYKYYVAYKLTLEHDELRKKLREQIQKGS